jgi:hypothetical protein
MDRKGSARQRLQLRRARIRKSEESIAQRDWMRGCYAMGAMLIAFEVLVFLAETGVL